MTGAEIAVLVYVLGYALCFVLFWFVNQWAQSHDGYWETSLGITLVFSLIWFMAIPTTGIVMIGRWLTSGVLSDLWDRQVLFKPKPPKTPCNRKLR